MFSKSKSASVAKREMRWKKLLDFCNLLSTRIELPSLIDMVLRETGGILEAEAVSVILHDPETDALVFRGAVGGKFEEVKKRSLRKDEGIAGKCFTSGCLVVVNDVERDSLFAERFDLTTGFRTRSVLAVPIVLNGEVIGVLEVVNKRTSAGFRDEDTGLASSVAGILACAIERTRLIGENLEKMRLAAIGGTAAEMAHCIKNILNGLKGGSFIVDKGLEGRDLEKINKGWNIVRKNMDRISSLAMDMLSCCKERRPEYSKADINTVILEAVEAIGVGAEQRGVSVELDLDRQIPDFPFDPKGIHRCLMNLLTNAEDALAEAVGPKQITVESKRQPGEVHVLVRDTGCGMGEKTMQVAFTAFFSKKGSKGTGLGLPVTRKIIEEHGGALDVSSLPGEGTTWCIRLPLKTMGEKKNDRRDEKDSDR